MLRRFMQRFSDMRTIKAMCLGAERHANAEGQKEPGLEHFVLAALELPDGTARKAFERIGADPDRFQQALAQQYADALENIGVQSPSLDSIRLDAARIAPNDGPYKAKPAVQALMQQLANRHKAYPGEPLLGAHWLAVIATVRHGVAARAMKKLGVDLERLVTATRAEINAAPRG
jgi:ATP-dependent Clp protease ATP-binding subunit ClpA